VIKPGTCSSQEKPGQPPSDAVILFNGRDLSGWVTAKGASPRWKVVDGAMEAVPKGGAIQTQKAFGDCQLHIEWATPTPPRGKDQNRGNSGVFLMGKYEIQVLDSYDNVTYADGQAAAVYGQYPPLVNASRPPGEWQVYDIVFRRPQFSADGRVLKPARVTVFHNGVVVQDNVELLGPTANKRRVPYEAHASELPLSLQDHSHPVRFRNIWYRPLADAAR